MWSESSIYFTILFFSDAVKLWLNFREYNRKKLRAFLFIWVKFNGIKVYSKNIKYTIIKKVRISKSEDMYLFMSCISIRTFPAIHYNQPYM